MGSSFSAVSDGLDAQALLAAAQKAASEGKKEDCVSRAVCRNDNIVKMPLISPAEATKFHSTRLRVVHGIVICVVRVAGDVCIVQANIMVHHPC